MDPVVDLPRSLDRYRRQLERAIGRDLARRQRRRRLRLGTLVAAIAAVVVALNLLPSGDGGGRLGTVAPATAVERGAVEL
jgi:ferric-dicitrate binding protein FerR (iron transport regulator)